MRAATLTLASVLLFGLGGPASAQVQAGGYDIDRSKVPDSFQYYGPGGLWWKWSADQKIGRDSWWFYTGGNQKFYRILSRFAGQSGISIDFFRVLATAPEDRFRKLGLINEPNFEGTYVDPYGFTLDRWKGDPIPAAYPRDPKLYGQPTGIIGMRLFPNPDFTPAMDAAWKKDPKAGVRRYFASPGQVEPPYVVGITCVLCHVAFDPLNPPVDPVRPRWENLAANMGNQYLREGDLFFGAGRVVGGDANPDPKHPDDPYATAGLDPSSFLYQYGHTQQPGTSETSRFSYDFLNNPNTMNQIFNVGNRAAFFEERPDGVRQVTNHILKDGSDSIGIHGALLRVYINIGSEGDYWSDHLWNPVAGNSQKPFDIAEVRLAAGLIDPKTADQKARKAELLAAYKDLGQAWKESERRVPMLVSYLASYTPYNLPDKYLTKDQAVLNRGKMAFADKCATCHSNKQPFYPLASDADRTRFFRELVGSDIFLAGNTLSDDVRYPFNAPGFGINAARAMATNAVDGDIWANFSSKDYKSLPPLGFVTFKNPLGKNGADITTEFVAPGGGRGYYRTAALNSMWSTAPFLHNNSIGRPPYVDTYGPAAVVDPKSITIEGRLALFEDAMDQLLNPGKRTPMIKRTSVASNLVKGMPGVERLLAKLIDGIAVEAIETAIRGTLEAELAKVGLSPSAKLDFNAAADSLVKKLVADLEAPLATHDIGSFNRAIAQKVEAQFAAVIGNNLKAEVAQVFKGAQAQVEQALVGLGAKLIDQVASQFSIPAGTPLNLLLNLNIGKVPYALKAYFEHKSDPVALATALLRLSDCPDLVENRGHSFGSELSDGDKRALIEYLKTL